jgi:hypothetical protein
VIAHPPGHHRVDLVGQRAGLGGSQPQPVVAERSGCGPGGVELVLLHVPGLEHLRVQVHLQSGHLVLDLGASLLGDDVGRAPTRHPMAGAPPPLAGTALTLDLLDEAVESKLAQVVARRAAALADLPAELARRRGSIQPEQPEEPVAQRVRERTQRPQVRDLDGGFERGLVGDHGGTIGVQRFLGNRFFAPPRHGEICTVALVEGSEGASVQISSRAGRGPRSQREDIGLSRRYSRH